ncbi:vacuolar protein sorting-associated protein VTA1 homolog [Aplysia californica]|uniref:Vacuolar protein sorting-associated protein VTA1 homolog n=1 Tax=Aplysia californica TaxID=6500 RepID=A0ABM0JK34_APLCA|nr:vacuolar protein sorting-associated protein VTA1 homolog [Aplysia californica]
MAAPGLGSLPGSLKQIQHYLKTAAEHDKRDPVIAYYCRLYGMQKAMEIDRSSPEARQFLVGLMDYLEKVKGQLKDEEAVHNEVIGQAHVENYALKMFLYADNEDRAGRFDKNVVKSFYTAGMLMDVLSTFGEIGEDIESNKKYAKWKAAYIHKCLKNGETPIAGPMPEEGDDEAVGGAPAPGLGFDHITGPSMPPNQMTISQDSSQFPAPGAHAPPSTPQDPTRGDYQQPAPSAYQPAPSRSPQPVPRSLPAAQPAATSTYPEWTPPANPAGVKLTAEQYQKGIKYCKYASSAMQYEDSATAIDNLTKALKLLTTGRNG